jgi:hypothetical protein
MNMFSIMKRIKKDEDIVDPDGDEKKVKKKKDKSLVSPISSCITVRNLRYFCQLSYTCIMFVT